VTLAHTIVVTTLKGLTGLLCRIDDAQLARVPDKGPLIVVTNHVNILEIPIIYTRLQPRPVVGLVSAHRWENPVLRWLLEVVGAVPLRRGTADVTALQRAVDILEEGSILIISPEGTRSGHGRLQRALPGVVLLALHSGAPLLPIVYHGAERYRENLRRLRRTDFHLAAGRPFYLDARGDRVTRAVRRQMVDEIMYQLSALLPPAYRGVYADLNAATTTYVAFQTDGRGAG
jgi:1-acyl-sn-glycerol-3-phosphate acyltransferase